MPYLTRLTDALRVLGLSLDRAENAALDGNPRQTISMRCAHTMAVG